MTRTYVDTGRAGARKGVVKAVTTLVKPTEPEVWNEVGRGGTTTWMTVAPDTTVVTVEVAAARFVPDVTVIVGSTVCMPTSTYVDTTPPIVVNA